MCLLTSIRRLVAKNDIPCYKVLIKEGRGKYLTPSQKIPVKLGEEMVTHNMNHNYSEEGHNAITAGYIHAFLSFDEKGGGFGLGAKVFKAVIPSGTEFYVTDDFTEICARKLFITKDEVKASKGRPLFAEVSVSLSEFYPQNINENEVAIGDFCMIGKDGNKSYIHCSEYTPEIDDDIIGVVGFFNTDGKPVVVSRDEAEKEWCILRYMKQPLINDAVLDDGNEYKKSMNGKELTANVIKSKGYKPTEYPMFKWVYGYKTKGTKKGDWYVGAIGELKKMFENTLQINISLMKLKGATILHNILWSSSESAASRAWYLYSPNSLVCDYYSKCYSYNVRAFATF